MAGQLGGGEPGIEDAVDGGLRGCDNHIVTLIGVGRGLGYQVFVSGTFDDWDSPARSI